MEHTAYLEAGDGTFLGSLKPDEFDENSIFNTFGTFGNSFSSESIFNRMGKYGDSFSSLSAFNPNADKPPKIFLHGRFIAFLSNNNFLSNRIDPDEIREWAERNVSRL